MPDHGAPAKILDALKAWKSQRTDSAPILTVDQGALLLRISSPVTPEKGVIYWSLQWGIPLGRVNYYPTGIPLSCCKPDQVKRRLPGMEPAPLKERRWGPGLAYPAPWSISSCLDSAASMASTSRSHNWVPKLQPH